jgi:hypothetical protein
MSFCFLFVFLTGSNWILHIVSELIFAVSKKKYACPEFPVLECGDAEKYQVGTQSLSRYSTQSQGDFFHSGVFPSGFRKY